MGTLQTSGNIRLSGDVAPHFGAGSAVLGQFKRGGSYVPNTSNIWSLLGCTVTLALLVGRTPLGRRVRSDRDEHHEMAR